MTRRASPFAAAVPLAVAALLAAASLPAAAARPPSVGEPAPALEARLFDGRALDLVSLRGQVVVLNVWASWCAPCRHEMPMLDALARDYAARGVTVLGLSADDRHDRREAERIAGGFHYALGMLSEAPRNGFGMPTALPLTYVIDPQGTVVRVLRAADADTDSELRAVIEAALAPARDPADDATRGRP